MNRYAKRSEPIQPSAPAALRQMCAMPGCPYDAKVRVGTPRAIVRDGKRLIVRGSPWRQMCCSCADEDCRKEARAWCESQGLRTSDQVRARMRDLLRDMLRERGTLRRASGPVIERQPGEDIEEACA